MQKIPHEFLRIPATTLRGGILLLVTNLQLETIWNNGTLPPSTDFFQSHKASQKSING